MVRNPNRQNLVAYRTMEGPSTGSNLCTLGAYQMQDALKAGKLKPIENLKWVYITFKTASGRIIMIVMSYNTDSRAIDRLWFTGDTCSSACASSSRQRRGSTSSSCRQHRGQFSMVKHVYLKELETYNSRHNSFASTAKPRRPT